MEYYVVWKDSVYELTEKVNEKIKEGWVPQGGICIAFIPPVENYSVPSNWSFAQALIRGDVDAK